ncbi:MAG: hypothetical protein DRQ44_02110 [Gammaproteobacteria bacterium]|nr:MAG: hypothetical protein DRQ44_02110 [Gammaproteobacteria bacterium]
MDAGSVENARNTISQIIIAVPLTRRDMDWEHQRLRPPPAWQIFAPAKSALPPSMVVGAGVEPPWMGSRRVSGWCYRFMSRITS